MALVGQDCYYFYASICTKGASCSFRHVPAAKNKQVCSQWQRTKTCAVPSCPFRHADEVKRRDLQQCYWETQPSGCAKVQCPFMHMNKPVFAMGGPQQQQRQQQQGGRVSLKARNEAAAQAQAQARAQAAAAAAAVPRFTIPSATIGALGVLGGLSATVTPMLSPSAQARAVLAQRKAAAAAELAAKTGAVAPGAGAPGRLKHKEIKPPKRHNEMKMPARRDTLTSPPEVDGGGVAGGRSLASSAATRSASAAGSRSAVGASAPGTNARKRKQQDGPASKRAKTQQNVSVENPLQPNLASRLAMNNDSGSNEGRGVAVGKGKGKGKVGMQARLSGTAKVSNALISSGIKSRLAAKKSAGEADAGPASSSAPASSEDAKRAKLLARLKGSKSGNSAGKAPPQKASILSRMSTKGGAGAGAGARGGGEVQAAAMKKVNAFFTATTAVPVVLKLVTFYTHNLQNKFNNDRHFRCV
eukprot:gene5910-34594_t